MNVKAETFEPVLHEFELTLVLGLGLLPEASGRGISRVRKSLFAEGRLSRVEIGELSGSEKHLAANLDNGGVTLAGQALRD